MKPVVIGVIILVVIILAGGVWYAYSHPAFAAMLGFKEAPAQSTTVSSTNPNGNRRFGENPGGFAAGSIETLNGDAFTITLTDGTTKNINITATTTLENYTTASSTPMTITPDQLSVGEQVFVTGSPNADGSINATRVMTGTLPTRPTGGRGFGPHTTSGIQNGANGGQVLLGTPEPD